VGRSGLEEVLRTSAKPSNSFTSDAGVSPLAAQISTVPSQSA
jgi:hypothetical protein